MQYYIHDGKTQQGPYSKEEVKMLNITPDTLVWHEGLDDWTQAKNIFEFASTPPPLKKMPPVLSKNTPDPLQESTRPKSPLLKYMLVTTALLGIVFGTVIIGQILSNTTSSNESSQPNYYPSYNPNEIVIENKVNDALQKKEKEDKNRAEEAQKQQYRKDIASYLNPHTNDYKRDPVFGNVWDVQIKIDNNTPYKMDKVLVRVNYLRADKNTIQTEIITFHDLKPGVRQILEAPGCKGAYEVTCYVETVESNELY